MLIDLHAHTRGISTCCRIHAPEVVAAAKESGLDGIVLTNHYQKSYIKDGDYAAFAKRYVEEYDYARECGEAIGCKVFYGIEVTMEPHDRAHMLIYGVGEDFVTRYPTIFDCTQAELHHLVHENGGILVQAHPLRKNKNVLLDPALLTGVEISCHPLYEGTHLEELTAVARDAGLILTCGGDYHADTHRPHCGVYLPDSISTSAELGAYFATTSSVRLCVHEVGAAHAHDVIFERGRG